MLRPENTEAAENFGSESGDNRPDGGRYQVGLSGYPSHLRIGGEIAVSY